MPRNRNKIVRSWIQLQTSRLESAEIESRVKGNAQVMLNGRLIRIPHPVGLMINHHTRREIQHKQSAVKGHSNEIIAFDFFFWMWSFYLTDCRVFGCFLILGVYARLCVATVAPRMLYVGEDAVPCIGYYAESTLSLVCLSRKVNETFLIFWRRKNYLLSHVFTIGKNPMLLGLFMTRGHCPMTSVVFLLYSFESLFDDRMNRLCRFLIRTSPIIINFIGNTHVLSDNPLGS